ncbi:tRNA nuclease CdiA-2 [Pandoraea sputorum]|nr:tRNA nuclease CdiA-2 [Pandoraea sputorum]
MGGLGATLDPVSPQVLISNLPASLQPSTTTFYFSPQQEAIQLQQAALMQTGKASFINGLSTDSTSQLTVNDQQTLVLYGNAVEYAKTNNIQLGQALTPEQVAGLSQLRRRTRRRTTGLNIGLTDLTNHQRRTNLRRQPQPAVLAGISIRRVAESSTI